MCDINPTELAWVRIKRMVREQCESRFDITEIIPDNQ
jgi:transposase